jgi:hypothetical protein
MDVHRAPGPLADAAALDDPPLEPKPAREIERRRIGGREAARR